MHPGRRDYENRPARTLQAPERVREKVVVSMSLAREDVEKVALLARLELSPDEVERLTAELQQIVAYVDLLGEVDTTGVEPMAHAVEVSNVFSADAVRPSLPREEALANSARHSDEAFLVPAVLGD